MNRRNFLRIAGTGAVIVAATGTAFVTTRAPEKALQPWRQTTSLYNDPMRMALSHAILAPNPHNRQPWQVELISDTEAVLSCDLERLLPDTDPYSRQIVIGLGCFLELFELAAREAGYRASISLFPQGEPGEVLNQKPVAHLKLDKDAGIKKDPLFQQVLQRRTNRNPYDTTRRITSVDMKAITAVVGSDVTAGEVSRGDRLQKLRELTRNALRDEILDPVAFGESIDLMRIGRREIEASPDGISIGGAFLEALALAGLLSREQMADPKSQSFQIGLDMADEQALTSMGFLWINTPGNQRRQQIAAGRAYLRMAFKVSALGLSMQPMSQALQEYQAMQSHYRQAHQMLTSSPDERIQMLARVGYAEAVGPAPRWALNTRIKQS